ncbi:M1 family metallopeptidase [Sphingomonas sp.]|uniref:M1 family metallopeptidase n=1 Tax=Sphingomonas sp. TaxID=28214 RepID=UPI001B0A375E|nr:M1 family metallopeptidase [Sphingomonas sp.]MBO9712109.1 ERAP1-like C-terminal domain-containing protein [Sphingomonas sp.]
MRTLILALLALLALFTPVAASAQALPTGKLPNDARPTAYRLSLTIVPKEARFSGHAEIDVTLLKPGSSIFMHGRDLHVTRAVAVVGKAQFPVTFTQVNPLGLARLDFGRAMKPGKLTLKFDYDAPFNDGPAGLYRINVENVWYSWTQFESIDARAAFPSFDEPGYKTPFTVSLTTEPGFVAASNAPEVSQAPAGKLVTHRFAPTLPLPTYLVAFVVGPFETLQTVVPPSPQRKTPLPLRVIATRPNAAKMQYALDHSGEIVRLLEAYFNQAFPYPKLDQVASPVMPGAMENAGIDIYGDDILLLGPNATTANKQLFGMVVAHELSHQWFGDLVTPAWWDDIWLNESFANWMGFRIGNEWRPDLNIGTNAIEDAFTAMQIDSLVAGRPIHEKIANDGAITSAFDQITYGKGGQVIAMIAAYMGDAKFREGVRLHMRRHLYGNASTDDFFASLAAAAKDPQVLASLRSFVDQQGVPVLTIHRADGQLTIAQRRYAPFGETAPAQLWTVPFCYRIEAEKRCALLDKASQAIASPGTGVIVPNAGGWGYYRFELDPADWDRLIATGAGLPAGEGLALDDSLWASFYAHGGDPSRLFAAARALAGNRDSNVAVDNGKRLADLATRELVSDAAMPRFRALIGSIYGPRLAALGFDPALGAHAADDPDRQKLRAAVAELVANTARDTGTRARLIAAADAWLGGDAKALDPQFMRLAFTVSIEERGLPYAQQLLARALDDSSGELRSATLGAIGDAGNVDVAGWFLKDFDDARLRLADKASAARALMGVPATRDVAANFMLDRFDALAGSNGGIFAARSATYFSKLCTPAYADRIDAMLRPRLASITTLSLDRALETIRGCAKFRDAWRDTVSQAILTTN